MQLQQLVLQGWLQPLPLASSNPPLPPPTGVNIPCHRRSSQEVKSQGRHEFPPSLPLKCSEIYLLPLPLHPLPATAGVCTFPERRRDPLQLQPGCTGVSYNQDHGTNGSGRRACSPFLQLGLSASAQESKKDAKVPYVTAHICHLNWVAVCGFRESGVCRTTGCCLLPICKEQVGKNIVKSYGSRAQLVRPCAYWNTWRKSLWCKQHYVDTLSWLRPGWLLN